jgi:glutathione S-transferase
MLRLYTFTLSHFSEKARWALDFNQLQYTESVLVPGAHLWTMHKLQAASSVPLLEHDGQVIQGSGAILDHLEQNLNAKRLSVSASQAARCAELEALADRAFGLGIQRIFYGPLLSNRRTTVDLWSQGGPWWSRPFLHLSYPLLTKGVTRKYKIRPDKVAEAKDLFRKTFDTFNVIFRDSPYLLGDHITRADITVASLLAPLCCPIEHVTRWPAQLPEEIVAFQNEFRGHPTWNFVLRLYRQQRRSR